jgi:CRP-like cAMP-binding protein
MLDARRVRIGRELFLAGLGLPLDVLDSWSLDRLVWLLDEQPIRAGEHLYSVGEPAEFLYFMRDGKVKMTREGAAPWTFEGRWLIGTFEALTDQPRDRDAIALVDFSALRIPGAAWIELLEDSFDLARGAVVNTARAVARLEDRIATDAPRVTQDPPRVGPGPLTLVERLALLVDVRMLRGGGVQALADLAAPSTEAFFETGAVVAGRGVEPTHMHLVVHGEVEASRTGPDAVRRYGPGDIVCGVASFGAPALAWEARATMPTRMLSFPIELWFDLMEEHFDMVRSALTAAATRRVVLLEHLAERLGGLVLT